MAGLDEDDGLEANLAHDGGEEDAGVDAVGLSRVVDLVEEAYVLDVGAFGWGRGTGNGGVGDAAFKGVVPDGLDLRGYTLCIFLVASDTCDDALREDVGEDGVDIGVFLVDVGGEEPSEVVGVVALVRNGEEAVVGGAVVDAQVLDVDFLVVDVAGEGEVGGALLSCAVEFVVLPFDGGVEGVALAALREFFL